MRRPLAVAAVAALLAACGSNPGDTDSGVPSDGGGADAGGPDGGSPDAGSADAGNADAGAADAGKAGDGGGATDSGTTDGGCPYRYCEGFESYPAGAVNNGANLGPWKATVAGTGVQVRIDGVNPRSGLQAFHVTALPDAGTARGTLNQRNAAGVIPGNNLFGRMHVFYSNAGGYGLPLAVHSWLFQASGTQSDGGSSNMNMGGGGTKLQLNYHPPVGTEQSVQGGTITAGVWHCLQWQYDGSGTPPADVANVWIDGTLAVNVPVSKGWTFPTPWNSFDFGFNHYQVLTNPIDVYVDDFALDGAMIPCQ